MKEKAKWGVGGLIVGAVAWWIVLGAGLGWMSPSAAQDLAQNQTQAAVVQAATPYCVAQFEHLTGAVAVWRKLQATESYEQSDAIKKMNLVRALGITSDSPYAEPVADACTQRVLSLKAIGGVTLAANTKKT